MTSNSLSYQLYNSHVLLPPQILLVSGTHSGHHIISVHYDVYSGIDQPYQPGDFTRLILQKAPREESHGGMMIHVQKGHLVGLLAKDEEHSVQKLCHFGEKVPPRSF